MVQISPNKSSRFLLASILTRCLCRRRRRKWSRSVIIYSTTRHSGSVCVQHPNIDTTLGWAPIVFISSISRSKSLVRQSSASSEKEPIKPLSRQKVNLHKSLQYVCNIFTHLTKIMSFGSLTNAFLSFSWFRFSRWKWLNLIVSGDAIMERWNIS